ncbi:MAG: HNH endonuclease, partial [Leptospiraceae bacterium]|nr:HNH endonuclease [Leptospiraceae bacterium]
YRAYVATHYGENVESTTGIGEVFPLAMLTHGFTGGLTVREFMIRELGPESTPLVDQWLGMLEEGMSTHNEVHFDEGKRYAATEIGLSAAEAYNWTSTQAKKIALLQINNTIGRFNQSVHDWSNETLASIQSNYKATDTTYEIAHEVNRQKYEAKLSQNLMQNYGAENGAEQYYSAYFSQGFGRTYIDGLAFSAEMIVGEAAFGLAARGLRTVYRGVKAAAITTRAGEYAWRTGYRARMAYRSAKATVGNAISAGVNGLRQSAQNVLTKTRQGFNSLRNAITRRGASGVTGGLNAARLNTIRAEVNWLKSQGVKKALHRRIFIENGPGVGSFPTRFHVRSTEQVEVLRNAFNSRAFQKQYLQHLYNNSSESVLSRLSQAERQLLASGRLPEGFVVHHKTPLFRGGTNDFSNLRLMRGSFHTRYNKPLHWYELGDNIYGP